MAFINNIKFKEIRNAAGEGNEKAQMILQAFKKNNQEDVDRLIKDYYSIPEVDTTDLVAEEPVQEEILEATSEPVIEQAVGPQDEIKTVEDLTDVLDKETDGLFDENEIESMTFADYLSNKKRDGLRSKKNAEYFSVYNPESRANYINAKKENYKNKFGDSIHDIDRQFHDFDKSIDVYSRGVGDLLDDEKPVDVSVTGDVYNEIMDNNGIMHSFGRYWDDEDSNHVLEDLKGLVAKYGKNNVLAALNVLKSDNSNFKDYRLNQINEEVERYNKSLDKVLK